MTLTIERRVENDTVILQPDGDLDISTSPQMRTELDDLIESGHKRIVLDMTRVPYMDSSGLGSLVAATQALGDQGTLAVVGCRPTVERVLRFTQMDRILELYRSFEDLQEGNRDNLRVVSGVSKTVLAKQKQISHLTNRRSNDRFGRRLS